MKYPVTICCFSSWLFPSHLERAKKKKKKSLSSQLEVFCLIFCQSKVLILFYKKKYDFISLELMADLISSVKSGLCCQCVARLEQDLKAPSCRTCPVQGMQ